MVLFRKTLKFVSTKQLHYTLPMAWFCSAKDNDGLVSNLKRAGIIESGRIEKAMKSIDRGKYVRKDPYRDTPQILGFNATISAPHMHAHALQHLEPFLKEGMKVLDVGSGSGYLTACFAEMVGPSGKVVGIEHIPELVQLGEQNVRNDRPEFLDSKRLSFVFGDGRQGYPDEAPYDCIHVGAAAPTTPKALIDQLKAPGRLFIPVGTADQSIHQIDKDEDGNITDKDVMGVMYVPLTDASSQLRTF